MRRLIEGGAYSKSKGFRQIIFFLCKKINIFLHPRPRLLPHQDQVADLKTKYSHFEIYKISFDKKKWPSIGLE